MTDSRINSAPVNDGKDRHEGNHRDPGFVIGSLKVEDSTESKGKISRDVKSWEKKKREADQKRQLEIPTASTQHESKVDGHNTNNLVHIGSDVNINASEELFEPGVLGVLNQPIKEFLEEIRFGGLTK